MLTDMRGCLSHINAAVAMQIVFQQPTIAASAVSGGTGFRALAWAFFQAFLKSRFNPDIQLYPGYSRLHICALRSGTEWIRSGD